jgi:hypothetical protein
MPSAGKTLSFLLRRRIIRPPPILLKYAGVKTWSAFARGAAVRSIQETNGSFLIAGYRTRHKEYWEKDPGQKTSFPSATTVHEVVERIIAILQDAARK